ncbi:MAG: LysR family transcriptional regulator [Actinobacteria bacterium]|nr:MAG: LysR family transcriptional regulator [Actinomycetota bacterium]
MLSVPRIRVLQAVAREGSFSGAAAALAYTQPAISQQIAALESEVGLSLVDRSRRPVGLTQAGEVLLAHAEAVFARLDAAEEDLAALAGLRAGRLRLGTFPTAGATVMPQAVARFRHAHPGVELSLIEAEPEEMLPQLRSGALDVALLVEFGEPSGPPRGAPQGAEAELQRVALLDDRMHAVVPAQHPLAERASIRLRELRAERWIQTSPGSDAARHVQAACQRAGFEPDVYFETDDYLLIQGLVAAGAGVALIPSLALGSPTAGVAALELAPRPPVRRVLAATAAGPGRAPAAEAMVEILRATASDYVAQSDQDATVGRGRS